MNQFSTKASELGGIGERIDLCLAAPRFYPVYSGPAMRFHRYEPGLRSRGIDMRVFAEASQDEGEVVGSNGQRSDLKPGELLPLEQVGGIPVQRVRPQQKGELRREWLYSRSLFEYCCKGDRRPHLVQHLGLFLPSVPWLWRLRSARVPMVFTNTLQSEPSHRLWKARLQRLYWRLPIQLMDCVVVSSGVMRDALRSQGVTTRIEVIPNGVNLERFHPVDSVEARAALRRKLGLEPDATVVLFVGGIIARKGIDTLLEAWSRVAPRYPRGRLVLVGPRHSELGPPAESQASFQPALDVLIERSGLSEQVVFTGAVSNVEDYYQAADVFAFPSEREGMPNVVLEAFACGLPTILVPFLGLPEEFGHPGEQYLLAQRTPEALATALETLMENQEQSQRLGQEAHRWVREHLDVELSLNRYAALYRELARKRVTQRR